ncbi:MAG TPA: class I tRNA ligase family protein, partial [Thermoplasmata archaeon]|nr:class I tRNA ligase family protein [Thermoplasmata archaeon]
GSVGSPRCLLCGTSAERRPSEHFYLKLDRLTPEISGFLSGNPDWRPNVAKVAANFLKEGLHATPITRDLNWGVPIPLEGYESKRFYVWFDAVIGYLSASKEWAIRHGDPAAWERFWTPSDDLRPYYFIGKDNIFHHTVLWPGVLLAVGNLALPRDVPANEWLVVGGKKLAKSRSGDRDAFVPSLLEGYAPDHIRFYAALLAPQNHDTEFDWDEFHRVHDEILANQYGNLVQRLLVLARDRDSGRVPTPPEATLSGSEGVGERIRLAHERITGEFEKVHLKEALELALAEIREGNRRFHEAKPWQADEADRRRAVGEGLWLIQAAAVWLSPFLPFSSSEVWRMLGRTGPPGPGDWDAVLTPPVPGTRLGEPRPLFPKRERPRGAPTGAAPPPVETAAPSAEVPLDVRAAKVLEAAAHPSADRLLVLTLDIGEERPRTVVAGIRRYYRPEELAGRRISLLSNLEPRTIRGVVSQGMILTVEGTERVELLEPPEGVGPGTPIEGTVPGTPPITHDDFSRVELVVGQVVGSAGEGGSRVDLGGREVEVPGRWIDGALVAVRVDRPGGLRGRVLAFGPGAPLGPPALVVPGTRIR